MKLWLCIATGLLAGLSPLAASSQAIFRPGDTLPQMLLWSCSTLEAAKRQANLNWLFGKESWDYFREIRDYTATDCSLDVLTAQVGAEESTISEYQPWGRVYRREGRFGAVTDKPAPDTRVPVAMERRAVKWYRARLAGTADERWVEIPNQPYALAFVADPEARSLPAEIVTSGGCRFPDEQPRPDETVTWSGMCVDGKAQGEGTLRWLQAGRASATYSGAMRDGRYSGQGAYVSVFGERYEGEWRDGRRDGRGVQSNSWGTRLDGRWAENRFSGSGVSVASNGNRYDGDWRNGRRHGRGTWSDSKGSRLAGDWNDGAFSGRGVVIYADGSRYEGDLHDDKKTGRGTFVWANGDRYEGDWRDDKRTGRGTYVWTNGARYDGGWRDDKRIGVGVHVNANGVRFEGTFVDDELVGRSTIIMSGSDRYEGEVRKGLPNGYGSAIIDGEVHTGEWSNGCFRQGNRWAAVAVSARECGFK